MVKEIQLFFHSTDHSPGSTVEGRFEFRLDKPKKYHSIVVELTGVEKGGSVFTQSTDCYKNSENYFHLKTVVWELENSPTGDLPAGDHNFPFSFELPENLLPSSLEGICCRMKYAVIATIFQNSCGSSTRVKPKHRVKSGLCVKAKASTDILGVFNRPKTLEKRKSLKFLCFNVGSVLATVSVPRVGFSPGETVPMCIHVSNESSRQIHVESGLHRRETFVTDEGNVKFVFSLIARTARLPIMPGAVTSYADRSLIIPTDMKKCSTASVEHTLTIMVSIPWSFNMLLKIPVFIADSGSPSSVAGPAVPFPQPPSNR